MRSHPTDRCPDDILRPGDLVVTRTLRLDRSDQIGLVIGKVRHARALGRRTYSVLFPRGVVAYMRSELELVISAE
jgi:hypothetical protein